uniref:Uncharacterized protein n=1 Tax=Schistocephalus solidus TaxID=70667 RepID=A0A0X3PB30_SCHSO
MVCKTYSSKYSISASMLSTCVLLAITAFVQGTNYSSAHTAPNSHMLIENTYDQKPESITVEDNIVPEGSLSKPCILGQSCWQSFTDKQFSIFLGIPGSGPASVIFTPRNRAKAPTAFIVNEMGSSLPDLPVPLGVGLRERLEVDHTKWTPIFFVHLEEVEDLTIDGGIQYYSKAINYPNISTLLLPHQEEHYKGKFTIFITGYIGNTSKECTVKFSDGDLHTFTILPVEGTPSPTMRFVSFSGANKAESGPRQSEL